MKKNFTFIFLLLVWMATGAQAQTLATLAEAGLDAGKAYTITCRRGAFAAKSDKMSQATGGSINSSDVNQQFAFVTDPADPTKTYLFSVGQQKFLTNSGDFGRWVRGNDKPDPIYVFTTGNDDYPIALSFTNDYSADNLLLNGTPEFYVTDWSQLDDGDRLVATPLPDAGYSLAQAQLLLQDDITVTYRVTDASGNELTTATATQTPGTPATAPAALKNGYVTLGEPDHATVSATDNVITYSATVNLPFTPSTGYADATWYYVKLSSKYLTYGEKAPYALTSDKQTLTYGEDGQWAFVGANPYKPIVVLNRKAGDGQALNNVDGTPAMGTQAENVSWWAIDKSHSKTDGFMLREYGSDNNYLNDLRDEGKMDFWDNDEAVNKTGSAFTLEAVDDDWQAHFTAAMQQDIDNVVSGFGTRWGDETASREFTKAKATFEAAPTETNYAAVLSAPKAYVGSRGLVNIANTSSAGQGYSIGLKAGDESGFIHGEETNLADANQLWVVTSVKKGYVRLYNPNAQQYIGHGWDGSSYTTGLDDDPADWRITWDDDNVTFRLNDGGKDTQYLRFETSGGNEGNLNRWSDNATWQATEVATLPIATHTLGDKAYATACYPFAVTLDKGQAYTATLNANGTQLDLTAIGNTIPAGQPVVIVAQASEVTDNQLTATITDTASVVAGAEATGDLQGTYLSKDIADDGAYTLGRKDGNVGFYHWSGTLKNKAYYEPSSTSEAKGFVFHFDGQPTGISSITADDKAQSSTFNVQRYNLAGQRVSPHYKGIVIAGGKKVIRK